MKTITIEEVKAKLDAGEKINLLELTGVKGSPINNLGK